MARPSTGTAKIGQPSIPDRQATPSQLPSEDRPLLVKTKVTPAMFTPKAVLLHSAVRELRARAAQPRASALAGPNAHLLALLELVPQEQLDLLYINTPLTHSSAPPDTRTTGLFIQDMTLEARETLFATIKKAQAYISNTKNREERDQG
jgi:hypothetical protein